MKITMKTGLALAFQRAHLKKASLGNNKERPKKPKKPRVIYIGGKYYQTRVNAE